MNATTDTLAPTRENVSACLAAFGRAHPEILRLELFGSVARGEATIASDVDVAATFEPSWKKSVGGFAYFGHLDDLEHELALALGRPGHLVDRDGVASSARIGNTSLALAIERDGQLVYEANDPAEGCA